MIDVNKILDELYNNKTFRVEFIEKYPEHLSNLMSYSMNKNCLCAKRIKKFILANEDSVKNLCEKKLNKKLNKEINDLKNSILIKKDMVGRVVELEANHDDYTEMIEFAKENGWVYNGLNVLESNKKDEESGDLKPIWLVFFF